MITEARLDQVSLRKDFFDGDTDHRITGRRTRIPRRIAGGNALDNAHAFCHFAENGITAIELTDITIGNVPLAAIGIRPGVGHGDDAFGVVG